jgi:acetate kinase
MVRTCLRSPTGSGSCNMQILVLNCGSSSVKAALYEGGKSAGADSASSELKKLATLHLKIKSTGNHSLAISRYGIDGGDGADGGDGEHGGAGADARVQTSESALTGERQDATVKAIETLLDKNRDIDLIVHRIVHGGAYTEPRMLTSEVITQIKALSEFAPLHNPVSLQAIEAMQVGTAQRYHKRPALIRHFTAQYRRQPPSMHSPGQSAKSYKSNAMASMA